MPIGTTPTTGTTPTGQGVDYNVDIVMCIDGTGSMIPFMDKVKENALSFYGKFVEEMEKQKKSVEQLRIKVIVFRDFESDSEPLLQSKFFELDDEKAEFSDFVNSIVADGGGDPQENALEALALAMKSDWVRTGKKRRHVIMLYTDAPALAFEDRASKPGYPSDMPKNLAELREWWEGQEMELNSKRMLIFAPDANPWSDMIDWSNTFHTTSKAGAGLDDTDINTCIHILVNSI